MKLKFSVVGSTTAREFELATTSLVGFFDGLKTAALDLTADATILAERNRADIALLKKTDAKVADACVLELRDAELFRDASVSLELSDDRPNKNGGTKQVVVKGLVLPAGALSEIASLAIRHAVEFQALLAKETTWSEGAVRLLADLDATGALPLAVERPGAVQALPTDDIDDILPAPTPAPAAKAGAKVKGKTKELKALELKLTRLYEQAERGSKIDPAALQALEQQVIALRKA